MKSWTKLAKIVKVTKNLDFVVQFTTRSFFVSDCLNNLCGHAVCIAPPLLDIDRFFVICNISKQADRAIISSEYTPSSFSDNYSQTILYKGGNLDFVGKYLLICNDDLKACFPDLSELEVLESQVVGMHVIDKKLGNIGIVKRISGGKLQKHLVIISKNANEVLIPYVEEIVTIIDGRVWVDCPNGLINLNADYIVEP